MVNHVTHFEINGRDGKRLREFYGALFGWRIDASNPMQYGLVGAEQAGIGGGISHGAPAPSVTVYVEVPDLAQALEQAGRLGGKTLLEPTQVPGGPAIAMFGDPEGNAVGLVKSESR